MGLKIEDIMTRDVISLSPNDNMMTAQNHFQESSIHHLPVIDDAGKLHGIISKHDYFKVLHGFTLFKIQESEKYNQSILQALLAKEVMTPNPICIAPTAEIKDAVDIFRKNQLHALPVMDGDRLCGIVTPYDIITHTYPESDAASS